MLVAFIIVAALVFQFTAAMLALRLIRVTGATSAWALIAIAMLVMVVRRCVSLSREGHTVVVASNGRKALAAWESQELDLILMDVPMPEIDGFKAATAIRAKESQTGKHIPIIALTTHALTGDRDRCLGSGMDEYITKPLRARQLFETVERAIATWAST